MKKILVSLFLCIFLMGFVIAQGEGISESGTGRIDNLELKEVGRSIGQGLSDNPEFVGGSRERKLTKGNYQGVGGEQIIIQERQGNRLRIGVGNIEAETDLEIIQEMDANNVRLKARMSNGRNAEIKIMPNTASEIALRRLRLRVCSEDNECQIELKEVGEGNKSKLVYEMQIQRHSRILGIFSVKMQVRTQVDAENGKVIRVIKPWWAFLAVEPSEVEEIVDGEVMGEEGDENEEETNIS